MSGYDLDKPADPPPPKPSLLNEGELPCPSCGKPLAPGTVVCMACGYDMLSGGKARTAVGEEEIAPPTPPIVQDKGLSKNAAVAIAIPLLVIAFGLSIAFVTEQAEWWRRLERGLLVLMEAVTSVGTGLVAIWFTAWLNQRQFGKVDLAAARLLACVAAFLLVFNVYIPVPYIGWLIKIAAAIGVYWLSVYLFIGRDRKTTNLIAIAHAVVTIAFFIQTTLWSDTFNYVKW